MPSRVEVKPKLHLTINDNKGLNMQISLEKLPVSERLGLIEELWKSIISDRQSLKDIEDINATSSQKELIGLLERYLSQYAKNKFYHKYEIENMMGSRGIRYLCHFTPIDNLESILNKGLYSREYIEENLPDALWTDDVRAEGLRHGICLSLSFPNDKMFYKKRKEREDIQEWAVIALDANKVISDFDCAFFATNAAFSDYRNRPLSDFMHSFAFDGLFEYKVETRNGPVKRKSNLADKYPTDSQAEIIVFDHIPPDAIIGCQLQGDKQLKYFEEKFPQFKFKAIFGADQGFASRDRFLGI